MTSSLHSTRGQRVPVDCFRAQSREALDSIRAAVIKAAAAYEKDGDVEIPMPAILVSAQKP